MNTAIQNKLEQVIVKENSWLAKIAAAKLRSKRVAIVWGRSIHLCNTSKSEFLADEQWVKHELCHVQQFRQYGTTRFVWLYLIESIRHGYYYNKFEVEARAAENTGTL